VSSGRSPTLRLRQGFVLPPSRTPARRPDVDIAGLYLAGAGIGASVAISLQRLGVKADALGAALTVAVAGAILAFSDALPELTDAGTYAEFVGAVGLVNVAWALLEDRSG